MEFEPAFSENIRGGLSVEGDTHGNCFEYVQMMASKLKRCGVKLITGRAVSSIFVKNTKVHGVFIVAPEEELPADVVVLAAGAGATALAAPWACGRDGLRRDSLRCHRALLRDSLLMRD